MPVMAKLSLQTYERLGEDVLDQLADWINAVYDYRRQELTEALRSAERIRRILVTTRD